MQTAAKAGSVQITCVDIVPVRVPPVAIPQDAAARPANCTGPVRPAAARAPKELRGEFPPQGIVMPLSCPCSVPGGIKEAQQGRQQGINRKDIATLSRSAGLHAPHKQRSRSRVRPARRFPIERVKPICSDGWDGRPCALALVPESAGVTFRAPRWKRRSRGPRSAGRTPTEMIPRSARHAYCWLLAARVERRGRPDAVPVLSLTS